MAHLRRRCRAASNVVLTTVMLVTTTCVAVVAKGAIESAAAKRPNIVFVFIDDLGYGDLSVTGNRDVRTRHIDRLAAEGIRFTQFYVASPICSPSRVGVTTGRHPGRFLIHSYLASKEQNRRRGMRDWLDPTVETVARSFQQAGYRTAHFGKWHMGGGRDVGDAPLPTAYGFDESLTSFEGLGDRVLPPGGLSKQSGKLGRGEITHAPKHRLTEIYVAGSINFIRRNRDRPFYLHLWLNDVHDAHVPSEEQNEKFVRFSANKYRQRFYAVLDEMDRQIGRLITAIDEEGLAERTLIVLTSDNGPTAWPKYYREGFEPPGSTGGFRGRKWSLFEGGIRMPLIVRWKGTVPAGRVDEESVAAAVDLFPTFCALADVEPPDVAFDGQDVSAAFLGRSTTKRERPLFWEYGRDKTYLRPGNPSDRSPNLAIREGDWKLLINADGTAVELYNLAEDPQESVNLAAQQPAVAARMIKQVLSWRKELPTLKATPEAE